MQRKGTKCVPTEEDIIQSNKISFGDAIGSTTNVITSQICLQARFPKDSKEYEVLDYRIICGQHYQQCTIDRTKGIVAKPMPRYWYDNSANKIYDDDPLEVKQKKLFNQRICADKKPYFFIYNYPTLLKEYNKYIKDADSNSYREYGITLDEMLSLDSPTKEQKEFIDYYYKLYPVNNETCLVNEICWSVEEAFKEPKKVNVPFDYTILKSDATYTKNEFAQIAKIYDDYTKSTSKSIKDNPNEPIIQEGLISQFKVLCYEKIPDEFVLCNILLDIGYKTNKAKGFIWDVCGETIIKNLLNKNNGYISIPVKDSAGEISYCGEQFSMKKIKICEE